MKRFRTDKGNVSIDLTEDNMLTISNTGTFSWKQLAFLGMHAGTYTNDDVQDGMEFVTSLTTQYQKNWTEWEVLREFLSNALDEVALDEDDKIGTFGEGSKLATLTVLRLGLKITVASSNWVCTPFLKDMGEFFVLAYRFNKVKTVNHTVVSIETNNKLRGFYYHVDEFFLHFDAKKRGKHIILDSEFAGQVFIKNVFITKHDSLFAYNLSSNIMNRDRSVIDHHTLMSKIAYQWAVADNASIKYFIDKVENKALEFTNNDIKSLEYMSYDWKQQFVSLYGKKACAYTSYEASEEAAATGWKIIHLPLGLVKNCNIPTDEAASQTDERVTIKMDDGQKTRLKEVFNAIGNVPGYDIVKTAVDDKKVYLYAYDENTSGNPGVNKGEAIGFREDIVTADLTKLVNVAIHESIHRVTRAEDNSRTFENILNTLLAHYMVKALPYSFKISAYGIELPTFLDKDVLESFKCGKLVLCENEATYKTIFFDITFRVTTDWEKIVPFEIKEVNGTYYMELPSYIRKYTQGNKSEFAGTITMKY